MAMPSLTELMKDEVPEGTPQPKPQEQSGVSVESTTNSVDQFMSDYKPPVRKGGNKKTAVPVDIESVVLGKMAKRPAVSGVDIEAVVSKRFPAPDINTEQLGAIYGDPALAAPVVPAKGITQQPHTYFRDGMKATMNKDFIGLIVILGFIGAWVLAFRYALRRDQKMKAKQASERPQQRVQPAISPSTSLWYQKTRDAMRAKGVIPVCRRFIRWYQRNLIGASLCWITFSVSILILLPPLAPLQTPDNSQSWRSRGRERERERWSYDSEIELSRAIDSMRQRELHARWRTAAAICALIGGCGLAFGIQRRLETRPPE